MMNTPEGPTTKIRGCKYRVATMCLASMFLLVGCAVGPKYHRPPVVAPPSYKEVGRSALHAGSCTAPLQSRRLLPNRERQCVRKPHTSVPERSAAGSDFQRPNRKRLSNTD